MDLYECFSGGDLPFAYEETEPLREGDDVDTKPLCEGDDRTCDFAEDCLYSCANIDSFLRLTDKMVGTIIGLEENLVRWRQALIKYLPRGFAEGLRQDIFNDLSVDFEGDQVYDLYVRLRGGVDPQQDQERIRRLYRLADGTDETSIKHL